MTRVLPRKWTNENDHQGAYSGKLLIWDVKTQALIRSLEGPEDIEWLDWHSKGGCVGKDCPGMD